MYDKKFPESEVWIGTGKIAFTPDDWVKKKSSSENIAGIKHNLSKLSTNHLSLKNLDNKNSILEQLKNCSFHVRNYLKS